MNRRPHIAWPVALRVAGMLGDPGPAIPRPAALRTVAALRVSARRAGELVVERAGIGGGPAGDVVVVDRPGWVRLAGGMTAEMLARLPGVERPDGVVKRLVGLGYGTVAGAVLAVMGRGMLGQFDPLHGRLVLLAPSIVEVQRRWGLVPDDLHLWVGLHEQTHAVQFSAAPWLLGHLEERMLDLLGDDPAAAEMASGLLSGRGLGSVMLSATGQARLAELVAAMSFLEGHADFVTETVARDHIPTAGALAAAFRRSEPARGWRRFIGGLDKAAQYRMGLGFCRRVAEEAGAEALGAAFEEPGWLPGPEEIADPRAWLRRVHGQA